MNERIMIIDSISNFLKENDYRSDDIVDMYNAWSGNQHINVSNDNVLFAINTLNELLEVK